ncbi:gamma-glutamyltransferase [Acidocella facilis]|uniref:gamma-glutamyltransferase n=1 Tax=Acidocella facilis TaxID=525 RepID=UPI000479E4A9|nr:gamma-glutamyltransferase [Acidocella facilis]
MQNRLRAFGALAALSLLTGCGVGHSLGHELLGLNDGSPTSGTVPSQFGYAVADAPEAAVIGRDILNRGGNAVDAAAAEGFAQAVTLPSRGGLGGGGACIIKMPGPDGKMQKPVMLSFPAGLPAQTSGDRPAAVPLLARGLLAMQVRYGQLPLSSVIVPAERLAGGAPVSQALESDLQVVGNALLADPQAAAVFAPGGTLLAAGANLQQPDLAATLESLRVNGVNGLYAGIGAAQFAKAADQAGGGLTTGDLVNATPHYGAPDITQQGGYQVASLPVSPDAAGRKLPASASFMALDKKGGAVICVTSMNNLFGTGRIAPGTGILLAASPRTAPTPDLAAEMAYTGGNDAFRAAATGTGQNAAAAAARIGLDNALTGQNAPIPAPGRANIISCPNNVPGGEASCRASTAPGANGLAIGGR